MEIDNANYRVLEIIGDGRCLFRAVAQVLSFRAHSRVRPNPNSNPNTYIPGSPNTLTSLLRRRWMRRRC
jgi:hypothetical protein